ncbi:vacuole effluxer Atg22 like-domain-containing protein [Entophlyctis helioformis]|nr:vacuole effluxer Atg22 like-domain-containing protein [Entophlyctis helioformis]
MTDTKAPVEEEFNYLAREAEDDAGLDHSPVSSQEFWGWKLFGLSTEGYSGLATAVFFPIILENLASTQAYTTKSINAASGLVPCNTKDDGYSCSVKVGSLWVDTSSYVFYATTISSFLLGFTIVTALLGISMLLSPNPPLVIKAREDKVSRTEYYAISDRVSNRVSSAGFLWGYVGSVIELIIGAGIAIVMGSGEKFGLPAVYPLQIGVAFSGVVMLAFVPIIYKWLKPRPGPPLPAGENFVFFSIKKVGSSIAKARQLSQLFLFLIGWFIYSDGFSTITSVAILFFRTELGVKQTELLIAATITPFAAGVGNWFWHKVQVATKATSKTMLCIQAFFYSLLCIYGLVGLYCSHTFGLRAKWEIYPLAIYHGFLLGATQATCRGLFSELLPPGLEAEFFSLYEITDKGSSWFGPLIRYAFWFLLGMMAIPIFIFGSIDVPKGKQQSIEFIENEERIKKVAA